MKLSLTEKDFNYDWFSGTGAGGQHRNKHQNCLRLTHIETGIVVVAQSHKSRIANKRDAYKSMISLLADYYKPSAIDRGENNELCRTYHLEENRITDHSTNTKYHIGDIDNFDLQVSLENNLKGQLDEESISSRKAGRGTA